MVVLDLMVALDRRLTTTVNMENKRLIILYGSNKNVTFRKWSVYKRSNIHLYYLQFLLLVSSVLLLVPAFYCCMKCLKIEERFKRNSRA